jgi:hypothetical protein
MACVDNALLDLQGVEKEMTLKQLPFSASVRGSRERSQINEAAEKRLNEILDSIAAWDYAQKPTLSSSYVWRKKNRHFKEETKEAYNIELFIATNDLRFIEPYLQVIE